MAKHLRIIALCGLMGLLFASCSQSSVVGTWVEPAREDGITSEIGFTLLENGEVIPGIKAVERDDVFKVELKKED